MTTVLNDLNCYFFKELPNPPTIEGREWTPPPSKNISDGNTGLRPVPVNASSSTVKIESGSVNEVGKINVPTFRNAFAPIFCRVLVGVIVRVVNLVPTNALDPIDKSVVGTVNVPARTVHPLKASSPMDTRPVVRVIDVAPIAENALAPIVLTEEVNARGAPTKVVHP